MREPHLVVVFGFCCDRETQAFIQPASRRVALENRQGNLTPLFLRVADYLPDYRCPYTLSLVFGRYAKRVQFNILSSGYGHEKPDRNTVTFNYAGVLKLKLLVELLSLFGPVPEAARGRNMNAHSTQKHCFEKRCISGACGSGVQHVRL